MDVKTRAFSLLLSFFLINCGGKKSSGTSETFTKTGTESCENATLKGEYLVHWKNGDVTIERSKDDETFINDFVEIHKDQIVMSEPHYEIRIEQKVEQQSGGPWGAYKNWGVDAIGAAELWDQVDENVVVKVAVIDSGVDIQHPELVDAIAINEKEEINGLDDDGNGLIDDQKGYDFVAESAAVTDYTGHGTHVAGTIAAQHNVGQILGVAPNVKIIPIAFLSRGGGGRVSDAVRAIRYASQQNAKVINASWGGPNCSTVLQNEIVMLAQKNILFVTAAGNNGENLVQFPEYPAAFDIENMITVGASAYDSEDCSSGECFIREVMAQFSNFGEPVDLMAPGAAITSTYPPEFDDDQDKDLDGIETINGTSMATPHVAGAAALLWSLKPNATYREIKEALLGGVKPGPFRVKTRGSLFLPEALSILKE